MKLLLWAILLFIQNFSFTMVSRARNSGSLTYHAIAAVFSNGIWFASQFILVDSVVGIIKEANWKYAIFVGVFYTTFTIAGSLTSHIVLMKWVEKGSRKVGSKTS